MTKEELIKEAWGYAWGFIDNHVKENILYYGWVHKLNLNINFNELNITLEKHPNDEWLYRPKSLQGIENNNGWVKIESEDDLPKDSWNYWVFRNDSRITTLREFATDKIISTLNELHITHYQPIEKPKPPIY